MDTFLVIDTPDFFNDIGQHCRGTVIVIGVFLSFQTDYDMIDYLNELREGCLEAYTGMVQGLKGDSESPNGEWSWCFSLSVPERKILSGVIDEFVQKTLL
jgi:hypothetical protein